jgi:hypothetical protein
MSNLSVRSSKAKRIPPPPGSDASYDEIIAYHSKYTLDELEKAGYAQEVSREEEEELVASAVYSRLCQEGLQIKLSRKDYELLSRVAARKDTAVETLVKRWTTERLRQEAKPLAVKHGRSAAATRPLRKT